MSDNIFMMKLNLLLKPFRERIKNKFNALSLREQQVVTIGSFLSGIALLYLFIWLPLQDSVAELRNQLTRNQKLLAWMQVANQQINQAAQKSAFHTNNPSGTASWLSQVQDSLKNTSLTTQLSQLTQTDLSEVKLYFKEVNFDRFIAWLIPFSQQQGATVTQISVRPSEAPRLVTVECYLKSTRYWCLI